MTEDVNDGLAALTETLRRKMSGWHWITNPETGALALFPETAKDTEEWEIRCIRAHEDQEIIRLADKPTENTLATRKAQITRGD